MTDDTRTDPSDRPDAADPAVETADPAEPADAGDAESRDGDGPPVDTGVGDGGANPVEEELAELNERHLRLVAEFSNYRRRQESERLQTWGRAQAELVGRFLDVLDDLQRVSALEIEDEAVTIESIVEGIDLVERKFVRTLEEAGAEPVEPGEGDPFDPESMEAMMRVQADDPDMDDTVAQVIQTGYRFKDILVRPARVGVYKA